MNGSVWSFFPLMLTPGTEGIFLRDLCGADELEIENTGTKTLLDLIESLMQGVPPENKVHAARIVTADRDRLVAMLYMYYYGPKVESTIVCNSCREKYDLGFLLDDLLRYYEPQSLRIPEQGIYTLEKGINFRLPTGEDEIGMTAGTKEEREKQLFERCLVEGNPVSDSEKVQLKMAELAPVLSLEMKAFCPECSQTQAVRFDMQTYFLTKLKQERPLLIREIHAVARHYHWSHHEILELPRKLRKQYVAMIQSGN